MHFWTSRRTSTAGAEPADAYGVLRALLSERGPDDRGVESEAAAQILLRHPAAAAASFWGQLADEAEYHGVAPLIAPMIAALSGKSPSTVPEDARRAFLALASRHRRASAVREECIDGLLTAFAAAGIPVILLKGAAIAHLIYSSPDLRPMVDIDVLIDPANSPQAVEVARGLGFIFAAGHPSRFAGRMHHLPAATVSRAGFQIVLEIHFDAMSANQAGRLTLTTLAATPQPVRRGAGPEGLALGHTDMLRHLARHAFEPAHRIRLIHLYDLWRYPVRFHDQIDWRELEARCPDVIVILRLVSYVFPNPSSQRHPPGPPPPPDGVGRGMVPLSEIACAGIGPMAKLAALFGPPAWWLHGFYGVPPGDSLLICRTVRHPVMVARWMAMRLAAAMGFWRNSTHGRGDAGDSGSRSAEP
jgi:hypothetical protein